MRLPSSAHTSRPWLIHQIAEDFALEDVWALATPGAGRDDFPALVAIVGDGLEKQVSAPARALFWLRWKLGALLRLDRAGGGLGTRVASLRERLPEELRAAATAHQDTGSTFTFLYEVADERAMEIANRTMHGVVHFGWVPDGRGGWRGQLAILVKPNGRLGTAYMAFIKPFRYLIVYPSMLRACERAWRARPITETHRLDKG
ncbi:MAG: hypothetical protein AUG49_19430 [Catenulispora sp. 13_1_20CM_3_70_7]|jgi:hypothetical protein|nr:MAG: hypothetical protein AUG49_19430 [Catenulispora sp. 13_1_20CM_3_70_7]